MTREDAIREIESLYPADSEYETTALIGQSLLEQAKREKMSGWRAEPTEVLIRYAQLCQEEEHNNQRTFDLINEED